MLEKLAKSIEEVNVLAEHYRTCQNVAAIESLAKECFGRCKGGSRASNSKERRTGAAFFI